MSSASARKLPGILRAGVPRRFVTFGFLAVVLPAYAVRLLLGAVKGSLVAWAGAVPFFFATAYLLVSVKEVVSRWETARRARRLGARQIPKVQGRLPGNLDVLKEFHRRFLIEPPGTLNVEMSRTYGKTYNLAVLGGDMIVSSDPAVIKHVLTGIGFQNYEKGQVFNAVFEDFLGSGIFNSDGDRWKAHRAMTRPYFAKDKISDFDVFSRHTSHLIRTIENLSAASGSSAVHSGGAVDIQELFGRFTLDSATEFLMGGSLSSLSEVETGNVKPGRSSDFLKAFNRVQEICYERSRFGEIWQLWELFENKTATSMQTINALVEFLIEKALASDRKVDAAGEDASTLLDHLIQETRDPAVLRDEVLNILLAARDTTMSTLSSAIYELARHPAILARLRAEVLGTLGRETVPTSDDARHMTYLRAFINEVLRLHPPVPFNVRASINEDVVLTSDNIPYYVPPKTRIVYPICNLQRDPDLWGPDAATFDPDRWLEETRLRYFKKQPFMFTPFSAGPRICLGQNFAYNEASFALIRLLQTYSNVEIAWDLQSPESCLNSKDGKELLLISQITLLFKRGLWVRFTRDAQ